MILEKLPALDNPRSPIKKFFWLTKTCHGHEGTNGCHSVFAQSLREAPLVHSCSCLWWHRKITPFGQKHLHVLPAQLIFKHFQSAAHESCHQTSSPRLLPVLPWLEVSSLRYAASRGNVDPQWRNPILPEMAKFYIVLLYRTQETIQKLMITGPCKFQTHLSWSESLILTSRSRTNHSLCTSLSCQEGQPKRKFVSNWN